jgi:hypothetical protein
MGPVRMTAGAWQSAGNCSLARKWAREIGGP